MKYAMAPAIKGAIAGIAASVVLGVGDSKLSLGGMVWSAPTGRRLTRERAKP